MTDAEAARRHRDGRTQFNAQLTHTSHCSPASLQQFQNLQLHGGAYQNQYLQHHYSTQSTAGSSPYGPSDKASSALIAPQYTTTSYSDWPQNHTHDFQQTFAPHVSVEDSTQFGDWSSWDFTSSQNHDATAYRSSPLLTPHTAQEHKRASSSSSHASFGPHTPRASTGLIPRVEVFDSEGQGYGAAGQQNLHWSEDNDFSVSADEVKHFHQVFGALNNGGGASDEYPHLRYPRDVQRLQDPRIRQLMMSQESNGSRMGPPALPRTESTDTDGGCRVDASLPKLDRTMSDIYQDSLYNPNLHQAPASSPKPQVASIDSSPNATIIRERLAAANSDHMKARSQSPTNSINRERSPFKPHAPESPRESQFTRDGEQPPRLGSAYRMREWQKVQRDRAAAAQHQPSQIKSELTEPKTISPKEVALDYEEDEAASKMGSLFPEEQQPPSKRPKHTHNTVPTLKPAMTRESTRGSNASEISQPSFGSMATSRRESSQSNGRSQMNYPFFAQAQRQASNASNATLATESTNDFPAHLTSTESTKSEYEPSASSRKRPLTAASPKVRSQEAESVDGDPEELTYTCTYHGCTKRFESQHALQKHKRDIHHSTAHHSRNTSTSGPAGVQSPGASSSRTASVHPPSATTPTQANPDPADPEGHEASPGSIAERNSQAGPHICNRINPSTGRPCNSHFSRPYDLTRHEDTIHNNKKQKVRCMYCKDEKTFSRNDALTRHMRVVHPEVQFEKKAGKSGR